MITIKPVVIPLTHDYVFKAIAKNCTEFLYNLISLITGIDLETVKMGSLSIQRILKVQANIVKPI